MIETASSSKPISTLVNRIGWHIGIRSGVRFAPMTPATWATAKTSPLAIFALLDFGEGVLFQEDTTLRRGGPLGRVLLRHINHAGLARNR